MTAIYGSSILLYFLKYALFAAAVCSKYSWFLFVSGGKTIGEIQPQFGSQATLEGACHLCVMAYN